MIMILLFLFFWRLDHDQNRGVVVGHSLPCRLVSSFRIVLFHMFLTPQSTRIEPQQCPVVFCKLKQGGRVAFPPVPRIHIQLADERVEVLAVDGNGPNEISAVVWHHDEVRVTARTPILLDEVVAIAPLLLHVLRDQSLCALVGRVVRLDHILGSAHGGRTHEPRVPLIRAATIPFPSVKVESYKSDNDAHNESDSDTFHDKSMRHFSDANPHDPREVVVGDGFLDVDLSLGVRQHVVGGCLVTTHVNHIPRALGTLNPLGTLHDASGWRSG